MADPVQFDLKTTKVTQFGIGIDDAEGPRFVLVPVDDQVQATLREMVAATRSAMKDVDDKVTRYQPSEKHAAQENLHLPLNDELASSVRKIHPAVNLQSEHKALDNAKAIFCYVSRLNDGGGAHLTAHRRASNFKGVHESRLLSLRN